MSDHDSAVIGAGPCAPKVMHVITHLALGGAESVALKIIESLRDKCHFSVFAVLRDGEDAVGSVMAETLERWGVPVDFGVKGRFKSGGALVAALALARAARRRQVDVIHLHTEVPELTGAIAGVMSRRLQCTPTLRTVHNCELWIEWHKLGAWVTQRLHRASTVAVSNAAARADLAILGKPGARLAPVIHNGVAVPLGPVTASRDGGPFKLLFAGRFVEQKGADLLPGILSGAYRTRSGINVEVTVAGSGPLESYLAQELAKSAPGWSVRLRGPIPQLAERLSDFDAVLLPSRFEGIGLLHIEALLAGVPVIATMAPGVDEVLPPEFEYAAPVGDVTRLAELVANVMATTPEEIRAKHEGLRSHLASKFSVAAMGEQYLKEYQRLAGFKDDLA